MTVDGGVAPVSMIIQPIEHAGQIVVDHDNLDNSGRTGPDAADFDIGANNQ